MAPSLRAREVFTLWNEVRRVQVLARPGRSAPQVRVAHASCEQEAARPWRKVRRPADPRARGLYLGIVAHMKTTYTRAQAVASFLAKVDIRGEGECWPWK